ncbi:MAG: O-antigen ligase family protein [Candidatus Margulisiibacteriota bacterium]
MAHNLWYLLLILMPFLSVSPWQAVLRPPFYYGFFYYAIIAALFVFWILKDKLRIKWDLINILLVSFFLINGASLMINWNITEQTPISWAARMKMPHIYNLFVLVYLFMNILTIWLARKAVSSTERYERSLNIIIFSTAAAAIWGIIMVLGHMTGLLKENTMAINLFPRLAGTATEPQVFGNFLLLGWPLSLVLLIKRPGWQNYLMAFIFSLALTMTFSMGAWLGALAGIVFIGIFGFKYLSVRWGLSLAAILILVIGCLMVFSWIYPPYLAGFDKYLSKLRFWNIKNEAAVYQESIKGQDAEKYRGDIVNRFDDKLQRVWMAQTAVNMFRAKPLLGVGPGNYGFLYNEYKPSGTPQKPYQEKTHNAYMEVLAETGILGMAAFLAIMLLILIRSWPRTILGVGCYASVVALMVHGLSFGILAHNYTWLAMGLLWAQRDINA